MAWKLRRAAFVCSQGWHYPLTPGWGEKRGKGVLTALVSCVQGQGQESVGFDVQVSPVSSEQTRLSSSVYIAQ